MKGIIFDVDGVLLDSMPIWTNAGARYLQTCGVTAQDHLGEILFSMTLSEGAFYLQKNYVPKVSIEEIERGILDQIRSYYCIAPTLKEGAREVLEFFDRKEIPMVIATSTNRDLIECAFEILQIKRYFQKIFTCSEIGRGKSKPDIFIAAMKQLQTEPSETWLFEDGLYSVKTAKKIGLKVVGVYDKQSQNDQTELQQSSDIYCHSLTEFAADRGHHFLSL